MGMYVRKKFNYEVAYLICFTIVQEKITDTYAYFCKIKMKIKRLRPMVVGYVPDNIENLINMTDHQSKYHMLKLSER